MAVLWFAPGGLAAVRTLEPAFYCFLRFRESGAGKLAVQLDGGNFLTGRSKLPYLIQTIVWQFDLEVIEQGLELAFNAVEATRQGVVHGRAEKSHLIRFAVGVVD
jgi:hypothetical protein